MAALCYRPKRLILDDPFSGLDLVSRGEFVQGILEATAFGPPSAVTQRSASRLGNTQR